MDQKYNINNQLNLSQLIDEYSVPQKCKAKASEMYKYVYQYVADRFQNSRRFKQSIVNNINTLTYIILSGDSLPITWNVYKPLENLPNVCEDDLKSALKELYLDVDSIFWDIQPIFQIISEERQNSIKPVKSASFHNLTSDTYTSKLASQPSTQINETTINKMTPFEDILLDPGFPYIPRIDIKRPWFVNTDSSGQQYVIYTSLPEVPKKQSDISVSTDPNKLTSSELLSLFPNRFMKLRHKAMYERYPEYPSLEYDDDLGVIFPIPGFSKKQIIDNIIKYPDIINIGPGRAGRDPLTKEIVVWRAFDECMEIDGQLVNVTAQLWSELPELKCLPPLSCFRQEYVVRKYLLERDNGVPHKKEMFGTLYPFITLFMPAKQYIQRGYKDVESIALCCVRSRVSYYRSRNPVLLRFGAAYNYEGSLIQK